MPTERRSTPAARITRRLGDRTVGPGKGRSASLGPEALHGATRPGSNPGGLTPYRVQTPPLFSQSVAGIEAR
jgi:hypothetical protein